MVIPLPTKYRVWSYASNKIYNFNVEASVFCAFYKGHMNDNINFQHSSAGQRRTLLPLACRRLCTAVDWKLLRLAWSNVVFWPLRATLSKNKLAVVHYRWQRSILNVSSKHMITIVTKSWLKLQGQQRIETILTIWRRRCMVEPCDGSPALNTEKQP